MAAMVAVSGAVLPARIMEGNWVMSSWVGSRIALDSTSLRILALSFALVSIVATDVTGQSDTNTIKLKARTFVPPPVISRESLVPASRQHLLIQFEQVVLPQDVEALALQGVRVHSSISNNTVYATVPASARLDAITGIRWAGPLQPSDKISPLIHLSLDRRRYALVDLHPDADAATAKLEIAAAGGILHERDRLPATTLLVRITTEVVDLVSQLEDVAYIYPAPDVVVSDEQFVYCPGAMTEFGPSPKFATLDDGWDGPGQGTAAVTYNFTNGTPDIAGTGEEAIVVSGITEWGKVVGLTFSPTATANAAQSHQILWAAGAHDTNTGDLINDEDFDGPGGVLGHAFRPGVNHVIAGDIHFDEAENWADGSSSSFNLFSVALHEAGHAHGLAHSDDPEAVMFPTASRHYAHLEPDDVMGAQSIYAKPPGVFEVYTPIDGSESTAGMTEMHVVWVDGMNLGGNVSIDLYRSGVRQGPIASSTPNDGFFDWVVPEWLHSGTDYALRVTPLNAPGAFSENTFTIVGLQRNVFSLASPDTIPDNVGTVSFGSVFGFAVPSGLGRVVDIELENIGISYPDLSDLRLIFFPPGVGSNLATLSPGHCPATQISSSAPFNVREEATIAFGDDCPPVQNEDYLPDFPLRSDANLLDDPTGTWTFNVVDTDTTAGGGGTVETLSFVLTTAASPPGKFSPVFVDSAAQSPGAGTSAAPYTILEPALDAVSNAGEIRISAGVYATPFSTLDKAVTLTATGGAVTIE